MNEDSRPRERLVKFGVNNLSDAELFAIILEKGTKQENVIEMSNRLINKYGLNKLSECSIKELQEIKGIGFAKACQIHAMFELNKRHNLSKQPKRFISSAKSVFEIMNEKLKEEKQEHFIAILLNNRNYLIKEETLTKGLLSSSIIDSREVFKPAIRNSASRIILVHNHPSGNPEPSQEDLYVTKRLMDSGELLGIKVLDHVIIGRDTYWSWKESSGNF